MRVLQLIDSLEAGGAERMAVNYANALADEIEFSALAATRREGVLKERIASKTGYLFLNKKRTLDFQAVYKLRKFIKQHRIQLVQAHSSSFFLAVLVKCSYPKLKIIWHDHYGNRIHENRKKNYMLFLCSFFFSACFVVNEELKKWSQKHLAIKDIFFIPNFILLSNDNNIVSETYLKRKEDKRIICLANLKKPKNHITILKAFKDAKLKDFEWSLHFVGKIYKDNYYYELKCYIEENGLENNAFLYDSKEDVSFILTQANIGVLASEYEGFPVSLLEYGHAGLATICTNAGFCSEIIKEGQNGLLFNPYDQKALEQQFLKLIFNFELQRKIGLNLKNDIRKNYSFEGIKKRLIKKYNAVLNE